MELETLQYLLSRVGVLTQGMAAMMSEVEPDKLPHDLVVAFNEMGTGMMGFMRQLVREVENLGYTLPPEVTEYIREIEEMLL